MPPCLTPVRFPDGSQLYAEVPSEATSPLLPTYDSVAATCADPATDTVRPSASEPNDSVPVLTCWPYASVVEVTVPVGVTSEASVPFAA